MFQLNHWPVSFRWLCIFRIYIFCTSFDSPPSTRNEIRAGSGNSDSEFSKIEIEKIKIIRKSVIDFVH